MVGAVLSVVADRLGEARERRRTNADRAREAAAGAIEAWAELDDELLDVGAGGLLDPEAVLRSARAFAHGLRKLDFLSLPEAVESSIAELRVANRKIRALCGPDPQADPVQLRADLVARHGEMVDGVKRLRAAVRAATTKG